MLAPEQRLKLHLEVFRRFFLLIWHVVPIMLITGYAMLFFVYGGFRNTGWNVHVMNGTGLVMAALFVFLVLVPFEALRTAARAGDSVRAARAVTRMRALIAVNLVLGFATVAVAAWR